MGMPPMGGMHMGGMHMGGGRPPMGGPPPPQVWESWRGEIGERIATLHRVRVTQALLPLGLEVESMSCCDAGKISMRRAPSVGVALMRRNVRRAVARLRGSRGGHVFWGGVGARASDKKWKTGAEAAAAAGLGGCC